jgi:predicted transcriptional regulator
MMELGALGLSELDGKVYVSLIGRPHATSAQIAADCQLSAIAAGRALARLAQAGLADRAGRPVRYAAVAPDEALGALIVERETRLNQARSLVSELMKAHRETLRVGHPDLAVDVLTARDDISALVQRIHAQARVEVCILDRPPYIDRPGSNFGMQAAKQRQGVRHRVIYDGGAIAWPGRLEQDILPSVRAGEQARVRSELPLKLLLADDQVAVIPLSLAPRGEAGAYIVHRSSILVALRALFDAEWERAAPLPDLPAAAQARGAEPAAPGRSAPDEQTRSLLTMLAAGLTDRAIARSLEWSDRTTQRRIQRLMLALGAATRFQACHLAMQRGWL